MNLPQWISKATLADREPEHEPRKRERFEKLLRRESSIQTDARRIGDFETHAASRARENQLKKDYFGYSHLEVRTLSSDGQIRVRSGGRELGAQKAEFWFCGEDTGDKIYVDDTGRLWKRVKERETPEECETCGSTLRVVYV